MSAAPSRRSPTQTRSDYLRDLGITAIELMPIHAFVQDRALVERGLRNYWGYNPLGFFCHRTAVSVGWITQ